MTEVVSGGCLSDWIEETLSIIYESFRDFSQSELWKREEQIGLGSNQWGLK